MLKSETSEKELERSLSQIVYLQAQGPKFDPQKSHKKIPGMVAHPYNPSTRETEKTLSQNQSQHACTQQNKTLK